MQSADYFLIVINMEYCLCCNNI